MITACEMHSSYVYVTVSVIWEDPISHWLFIFTYYAFEQSSQPIMLNIMLVSAAIIPYFVFYYVIFND